MRRPVMTRLPLALSAIVVVVCACGPDRRQLPPLGDDATTEQWLSEGAWRQWRCEVPHATRGNSPHGANAVCNNDALTASQNQPPFPVGAASVKALYADDLTTPAGFAVMLKTGAAERAWYVRTTDGRYASGKNVPLCESCHAAGTDFVFTRVP
jgi:hypothetical protein